MRKFLSSNKNGFVTVEIMVSIFIVTISVLAAMDITQRSTFLSRNTLQISQGIFLAEEATEALRIIRDNNWSNISTKSNATRYYLRFNNGTWELTEDEQYAILNGITRYVVFDYVCRNNSTKDLESCGGGTPPSNNDVGSRAANIGVTWYQGVQFRGRIFTIYLMNI